MGRGVNLSCGVNSLNSDTGKVKLRHVNNYGRLIYFKWKGWSTTHLLRHVDDQVDLCNGLDTLAAKKTVYSSFDKLVAK